MIRLIVYMTLSVFQVTAREKSRFTSREEAGMAFHRMGMEAAASESEDSLKNALPFLRGAVKAVPTNAEYWNDLGVSEARAGMLTEAKKRFSAALRIDAEHREALRNYQQVKADLAAGINARGREAVGKAAVQHRTVALEELTKLPALAGINIETPALKRPFIVRDALKKLGGSIALESHRVLDYLHREHGEELVDFYPQNMLLSRPSQLYFLPLSRAIDQITGIPDIVYRDVDASLSGSYAQWNMPQTAWVDLLTFLGIRDSLPFPFQSLGNPSLDQALSDPLVSCLKKNNRLDSYAKATHMFMTLLGEKSAGMHNHQDFLRTASFQLQLAGRKKWNICPPTDSFWDGHEWVSRPGSAFAREGHSYLGEPADVNMFSSKIDYVKHYGLVNATCFQVIVQPGDILYYPKDFWHQTLNLETPTVSISANVVSAECSNDVFDVLQKECAELLAPRTAWCVDTAVHEWEDSCVEAWEHQTNKTTPRFGFDSEMCQLLLQECRA